MSSRTDEASPPPAGAQVRRLIADGNYGSPWHSSDERIFCAALELFAELGFSGTSTRAIATRAGMSPGALYSHYTSKEDILYRIIRLTHEGMLRRLQVTAAQEADLTERLRALVACHVRYHAEMHVAARVANYELHCLDPDRRSDITELRRLMEVVVRDTLLLAKSAGVVDFEDVGLATILVLSLGIDVSRWYRTGGATSPEQLADFYSDHVLRMFAPVP